MLIWKVLSGFVFSPGEAGEVPTGLAGWRCNAAMVNLHYCSIAEAMSPGVTTGLIMGAVLLLVDGFRSLILGLCWP